MTDRVQIDAHCPVEEMSKIGYLNKELDPEQEGPISVWIYSREGAYIPHLHIKRKGVKNDVCVKFTESEYFIHGNKTGTLSGNECKWLDSILREIAYEDTTYWKHAIAVWNLTNAGKRENRLPMDLKQPDYTKLNK